MFELFIFFLISILIILSSGLFASNVFFGEKSNQLTVGELGLIGITFYTFLSFVIHFFLPLTTLVNFGVISFLIIFLFLFFDINLHKKAFFREKVFIFISFLIVIIMTIQYKPNEDYGYYHLPYIINLISEKIIFGLSNIQPQFAWNSSWLNFSSLLNLPLMELKGTQLSNSILYFFLLIFFFNEIKYNQNKNNLSFYFILFLSFYTLIKFSRISEHGFDFPANYFLILSIYYFIKIFETKNNDDIERYFAILIMFSTLSITIKLSTFMSPILVLSAFYLLIKKKINISKLYFTIFFCISFFIFWLIQQFIYSGCFVPFFDFTCVNSVEWHNPNIPKVLQAATGAINKSFNQYSGTLTEAEYLKNFNWVGTWFMRNKIELLEHFAAFFIPIFVLFFFNLKNINKSNSAIFNLKEKNNFLITLIIFLFFGLTIWFTKSPVIRFGIPYLYFFIFLIIYFILSLLIKLHIEQGIIIVIALCIIFNVSKNILRIENFEINSNLFPKILKNKYSSLNIDGFSINYPDPDVISSQSQLCWSTPFICHIEKGRNTSIKIYNNYFFILRK